MKEIELLIPLQRNGDQQGIPLRKMELKQIQVCDPTTDKWGPEHGRTLIVIEIKALTSLRVSGGQMTQKYRPKNYGTNTRSN